MTLVGIIANPASGKDIRRLVAHAPTVDNQQKVNIVCRMLIGLRQAGVDHVQVMPDYFGIGERAIHVLRDQPDITAMTTAIDMPFYNDAEDSVRAAHRLQAGGAKCIIVLGGDGTSRAVAKACGNVPILPVSTGTNNVLPSFVEGTVAGLAAGYVATHPQSAEAFCYRHKTLEVLVNGKTVDQCLIDAALIDEQFVGTKAIWDVKSLLQVFVTRAHPSNIGMSSVIGVFHPVGVDAPYGASVRIFPEGHQVCAPIAPGMFVKVGVSEVRHLEPAVVYPCHGHRPAIIALDGEREIILSSHDGAQVRLNMNGPWIVDVQRTMLQAAEAGIFEVREN